MVKKMTEQRKALAERVLSLRMGPAGSELPPKPLFSYAVIGKHLRRDPKDLYRLVERYIKQEQTAPESSADV